MKSVNEIKERLRDHEREIFGFDTENINQSGYEKYIMLEARINELEWILELMEDEK